MSIGNADVVLNVEGHEAEEEVGDLDDRGALRATRVATHERPVKTGDSEPALPLKGDLTHALVVDLHLGNGAVLGDVTRQRSKARVDGGDDRLGALAYRHMGVEAQSRPARQTSGLAALGDVPHAGRHLDRVAGLDGDAAEGVVQRHAAEGIRVVLLRYGQTGLGEDVFLHWHPEKREDACGRVRVLGNPRDHGVLVAALSEDVASSWRAALSPRLPRA